MVRDIIKDLQFHYLHLRRTSSIHIRTNHQRDLFVESGAFRSTEDARQFPVRGINVYQYLIILATDLAPKVHWHPIIKYTATHSGPNRVHSSRSGEDTNTQFTMRIQEDRNAVSGFVGADVEYIILPSTWYREKCKGAIE